MIIDSKSLENFKEALVELLQCERLAKTLGRRMTISEDSIETLLGTLGLETKSQSSPTPWRAGLGAFRRLILDANGGTVCELLEHNMACNRSRIIAAVNGEGDGHVRKE